MARGKVTLAYITNPSYRNASFRKRKKGIMKKVTELTTLCGGEACAIIYKAHDSEPEICPSSTQATNVLNRFESLPETDRIKKTGNELSYIRHQIKKANGRINRVDQKNEQQEMEYLMLDYLVGSPKHTDLYYKSKMVSLLNQTLEDINSKIVALKISGQDQPGAAMEEAS